MDMSLYRTRLRSCPLCATPMQKIPLPDAHQNTSVDLCHRCGGVFLAFFDGEPTAVSREIRGHLDRFPDAPHRAGGKPLECPDCQRMMEVYPYFDEGPEIARCTGCMAVFATATQARALSAFTLPPESESWLDRLLGRLRPRWID
jgi:Zn-finger nucleic acid-binding protein